MDIHGGIGAHSCLKHCFQDTDNIPRIRYGKNKRRVVKTDIQLNSLDQTVVWLFFFRSRFVGSCWQLDNHYCLRETKGFWVPVMRWWPLLQANLTVRLTGLESRKISVILILLSLALQRDEKG